MFLTFFGFTEQPFSATPDPKYLFWSHSHREALSSIYYAVKTERGIIALIAPPGLGKTTILYQFLERLRETHRTVFLFQTQCNSTELLRLLLADLGFETNTQDPVTLHLRLASILTDCAHLEKQLVVVIDEAQNLQSPVLESVRLLSNFEGPGRKMMQIVLSGQNQLEKKLAMSGLLQLRQRISTTARLYPLDPQEVPNYIEHRLQVAGHHGSPIFKPDALDQIVAYSGGIPRLINSLCFNSLSLACARHLKKVDAGILKDAAADMSLNLPSPHAEVPSPLSDLKSPFPHPRSVRSAALVESSANPLDLSGEPAPLRAQPAIAGQTLRANIENAPLPVCMGRPDIVLSPSRGRFRRHILSVAVLFLTLLGCGIAVYLIYESDAVRKPDPMTLKSPPSAPRYLTVTVGSGETMETITLRNLGRRLDPELAKIIMDINPQIVSLDKIGAGEKIRLPSPEEKSAAAVPNTVSEAPPQLKKKGSTQ